MVALQAYQSWRDAMLRELTEQRKEDREKSNAVFQGQDKIVWQPLYAMKLVPESSSTPAGEELASYDLDSMGVKRQRDLDDPGSDLGDPQPEQKGRRSPSYMPSANRGST